MRDEKHGAVADRGYGAGERGLVTGKPGGGSLPMSPTMVRYSSGSGRAQGSDESADAPTGAPAVSHAPVLQLQAAGSGSVAATAAGSNSATASVSLSVSWTGKFGGDLSAAVTVQRRKGKNDWETLTTTTVADPDQEAGGATQKLDANLGVDRHSTYRIVLTPTAAAPHNRYAKTTHQLSVGASESSKSVSIGLRVNRWNANNVSDVWKDVGIDPALAADTVSTTLFGRRITVNRLVQPRVDRTNALYAALPPETQAEILDSIAIMGGYAKRTTSTGAFSNHSVGCAIDINYNMDSRQNFHFHQPKEMEHLEFVGEVIKTDPAYASFDIMKAQGQAQLEASQVFNRRFPLFVAELLGTPIEESRSHDSALMNLVNPFWYAGVIREHTEARALLATVTPSDLEDAAKKTKDPAKKKMLLTVKKYWAFSKAWIEGRSVVDKVDKRAETLVGMIPLHEQLLQVFLDAGWSWGGDWRVTKDYMHFEDTQAMRAIKASASAPGSTP